MIRAMLSTMLLCGCATVTPTEQFAQTSPNPYRAKHDKCRPFAETLCAALLNRGVEAHIVHYLTWSDANHVFVAYLDGAVWRGQDQFRSCVLRGNDSEAWSRSFSGTTSLEFAFIER